MKISIVTKESVCIRKEFNPHRIGLEHQRGGRFIWDTNVAAVTSYENVQPSNTKGTSNHVSPASTLQRSLYYGTKDCLEFGIRPQEREKWPK